MPLRRHNVVCAANIAASSSGSTNCGARLFCKGDAAGARAAGAAFCRRFSRLLAQDRLWCCSVGITSRGSTRWPPFLGLGVGMGLGSSNAGSVGSAGSLSQRSQSFWVSADADTASDGHGAEWGAAYLDELEENELSGRLLVDHGYWSGTESGFEGEWSSSESSCSSADSCHSRSSSEHEGPCDGGRRSPAASRRSAVGASARRALQSEDGQLVNGGTGVSVAPSGAEAPDVAECIFQ